MSFPQHDRDNYIADFFLLLENVNILLILLIHTTVASLVVLNQHISISQSNRIPHYFSVDSLQSNPIINYFAINIIFSKYIKMLMLQIHAAVAVLVALKFKY